MMTAMKIALLGHDGSDKAELAAEWARDLAAAGGLELRVVRVIGQDDREIAETAQRDLDEHTGATARAAGISCTSRVVFGDPRDVLADQIVDEEADLVIVGDTGHWGIRRPPLGSVAAYLVHHSPRPLAVVPALGGPLQGGHLVVGVDASADSRAALEWAAALAAPLGAAVVAVALYDPLSDSYPHGPQASAWHVDLEPKVRASVEAVREHGAGPVDLRVFGANPVEGLLEVATEVDAAAIVVGARGRGGFRRLLVGGTAMQLLHHSDRPVVVVGDDSRHHRRPTRQ